MWVVGVGVVLHTLAEPEDYLLHVILIHAYLCDAVLNDVLCDNRQDFHVLVPVGQPMVSMVSHIHCF
jgi:hypothetical protein